MNKFEYKNLTPFKWFVLENFPFIEADFDALTDWQLFCKLGKEINKIINSTNILGTQVESLTDFVTNYFDTLDVQEEINNKLNEMAESGQLAEIISIYIRSNAVLGFQTKNAMKNAENLIEGSICRTLSDEKLTDGGGRYYLIRTITSSDIVDEINIVSLNISNTLIAQLINDNRFIEIKENQDEINNTLLTKQKALTELVIFGDSWSDPTSLDAIWGTQNYIGKELNLNVNNYALSGAYMSGTDSTSLQSQINTFENSNVDKSKVKFIVVLGGINDFRNNITWTALYTKLQEQIERLKILTPQAKIIYVSNCRWYYDKPQGDYWCGIHQQLRASLQIVTYNIFGTFGKEMFNPSNYFHLTQTGQKIMCSNIIACLTGGEIQYFEDEIVLENSDAIVSFRTQRVHNFVHIHFDIEAKNNFSSLSFANPQGYYFPYYPLMGGWSDRNYKQFAFHIEYNNLTIAVNGNADSGKLYHGDAVVPLEHL